MPNAVSKRVVNSEERSLSFLSELGGGDRTGAPTRGYGLGLGCSI
ncbi:hypothetical protein [Nostoc sp.]